MTEIDSLNNVENSNQQFQLMVSKKKKNQQKQLAMLAKISTSKDLHLKS
jgi:hypothetical protein